MLIVNAARAEPAPERLSMAATWFRQPSILPGFGLTLGFTTFFLSALVLLPLAALVFKTTSLTWSEFVAILLDERARRVLPAELRRGAARRGRQRGVRLHRRLVAGALRLPGPAPGRRADRPAVRAADRRVGHRARRGVLADRLARRRSSPLAGVQVAYTWIGVVVALILIGLPFVVRSVQPALVEVQRDLEEAAETLGAGPLHVFRRIILPAVLPALLTGFTLAFARGIGEYGSVVFISGNLPLKTEITPLLIVIKLEQFDYNGAAALGFIMLVMSFVMLFAINLVQALGPAPARARRGADWPAPHPGSRSAATSRSGTRVGARRC